MRRPRPALLAVLVLTAAAAACAGGGGGGGAGDDDDDVATSPTALPAGPDFCYVLWRTAGPAGVTEYYVDLPAAAWEAGGTVTIDDVDNWAEFSRVDSAGDLVFLAVATAGSLTVTAQGGLDEGTAVSLEDADDQRYTDYLRGVTATGGTGGFAGTWSDPLSPLFVTTGKTPGTGTVALTAVSGTAAGATVGTETAFAQCYDLQTSGGTPRGPRGEGPRGRARPVQSPHR